MQGNGSADHGYVEISTSVINMGRISLALPFPWIVRFSFSTMLMGLMKAPRANLPNLKHQSLQGYSMPPTLFLHVLPPFSRSNAPSSRLGFSGGSSFETHEIQCFYPCSSRCCFHSSFAHLWVNPPLAMHCSFALPASPGGTSPIVHSMQVQLLFELR